MSAGFPTNELFRLGEFEVDPTSGTLSRDGDIQQLQPKVMQLLLCLVENHGQIVSKEYLLEHVWEGTFVVDGALRRCVHLLRKALTDSNGDSNNLETLPRRGYRLLLTPESLTPDAQSADTAAPSYAGDAYRGLQVFEQSHADIFFGRQAAVRQVIGALDAQADIGHGFCLVLGPSGSGKSSLALAGVLPALLARPTDADAPTLRTVSYKLSESPADPLAFFASRVIAAATGEDNPELARSFASQIEDDEDAAVSTLLGALGATGETTPNRLILVFDQFEELLSGHHISDTKRDRLIAVLYQLVRSGAMWLIATMRSEFYPQFTAIESLRFLRGEHGQVDLLFPGAAEIADIVRKPAALAQLTFGEDEQNRRLDQIIIDDATRQANSLPLLQFALSELEMKSDDKVLDVAEYRALGSLEGCLSGHADRVFDALPAHAQAALPAVLERMVIADPRNDGRVLKRTVLLGEFESVEGATALVQAFIEARLITTFLDKTSGAPAAQFAHEAVLANWARGRDWVQANYAEIRFRSWLTELANRWSEEGQLKHYLLTDGKPLIEATRLVGRQPALPAVVGDFVEASNRRASMRDLFRGAVSVALVALTIASLVLWRDALKSSEEAQNATQRAELTSDFLQSIFAKADPGVTGGVDLTARQLLDVARDELSGSSLEASDVDRVALLTKLGETYLLTGGYDTADELFTQAQTLLPNIEQEHPVVAAKLLLELGSIRLNQSQPDEGQAYLERAIALAQSAEHWPTLAHSINVMGLLDMSRGENALAAQRFEDAKAALDKTNPLTQEAIELRPSLFNNQGNALLNMGELDAADAAYAEALELRREHSLDQTADQTDVLSNVGMVRRNQKRYAEAVDYFNQAIELRSRLHGPMHPRNAYYLANKSSAEMMLGQYDDGLRSAEAGLHVASSGSGVNASVTTLLYAYRGIMSWLTRSPISEQDIEITLQELDALGVTWGTDHAIIKRVRVAMLGQRLDAQPVVADLRSTCEEIAQLVDTFSGKSRIEQLMREQSDAYFEAGNVCSP